MRKFNHYNNSFKSVSKPNFAGEEYERIRNPLGLDLYSKVFDTNRNLNIRQMHVDHATEIAAQLKKIQELEVPRFSKKQEEAMKTFNNIEWAWAKNFEEKEKTTYA